MFAKIPTLFCLLFITSLTRSSEASEREFLKTIDSVGQECFKKLDSSKNETRIFNHTEKLDVPEIVCLLDCTVSELGLNDAIVTECSETDYSVRRKNVLKWIKKVESAVMRNGSFFAHFKANSSNSSRYIQLVEEAEQKCQSKFDMTVTVSSLFNPLKWMEEIEKISCSFHCMLAELKIINEKGLDDTLNNWIMYLLDVEPSAMEKINEEIIKIAMGKLNDECKFMKKSMKKSIGSEGPSTKKSTNGSSRINGPFESTLLQIVFISTSLVYSILLA